MIPAFVSRKQSTKRVVRKESWLLGSLLDSECHKSYKKCQHGSILEELIKKLPNLLACVLHSHDMSKIQEWWSRIFIMVVGRIIEVIDFSQAKPIYPYAKVLFDPCSEPLSHYPFSTSDCFFQGDCSLINGVKGGYCSQNKPPIYSINASHRVACYATQVEDSSC